MPEITQSWLPEEEACPQIIRNIHSFIKNRLPHEKEQPRSEDQRNMKGLFDKLSIKESSTSRLSAAVMAEDKGLPQELVGPEIDVGMDSDDSMLDQSRESFHNMAGTYDDVREKLRAGRGE